MDTCILLCFLELLTLMHCIRNMCDDVCFSGCYVLLSMSGTYLVCPGVFKFKAKRLHVLSLILLIKNLLYVCVCKEKKIYKLLITKFCCVFCSVVELHAWTQKNAKTCQRSKQVNWTLVSPPLFNHEHYYLVSCFLTNVFSVFI